MKLPDAHTWLLPASISSRLDLAVVSKAARKVGGDYYDFYKASDTEIGVILADISGHGEQAALRASVLQEVFRELIKETHQPRDLAWLANQSVVNRFDKATFVTALFMLINLDQMSITLVRCGHPFPLIYRSKTQTVDVLESDGLGMGITTNGFENHLIERSVRFGENDMLLACTDGALEGRNVHSEEFGLSRLIRTFAKSAQGNAQEAVDQILDSVLRFEPVNPDDTTLLAFRAK